MGKELSKFARGNNEKETLDNPKVKAPDQDVVMILGKLSPFFAVSPGSRRDPRNMFGGSPDLLGEEVFTTTL